MKLTQYLVAFLCLALMACQDDDQQFGEIITPSNLTLDIEIAGADSQNPNGDGTGVVNFSASANNAITYKYFFGDNTEVTDSDGSVEKTYNLTGVNDYTVIVVASGTGGVSSSISVEISVRSDFEDLETQNFLTGGEGSSKTWFVARGENAHLGVGPLDSATPDFFAASPNQLADCFYNDQITLGLVDGDITFNHDNAGVTFFNAAFLSVGGGGGDSDQCLPFNTSGDKFVSLSAADSIVPENQTTGTAMNITDSGFMSYFIGTSTYEVLEITEDFLSLRAISGNNDLAWYLKFTTSPDGVVGGEEDNMLETQFENLVWSDEFNQDTGLDTSIWNFETGDGCPDLCGWGNEEKQYYTEDNAVVEDDLLKITAKSESISGSDYSSSRITTKDNFDFQYGRIEVRAKLPEGGGTWPAIWMLGANIDEVGWPATGEIDIMEHVGNDQGNVKGTLHFPGNSGGSAVTESTNISDVSTEFHNYTVEWDADNIVFAVDDVIYHEFQNFSDSPFNASFFIIFNVAMGGNLGGDIDPDFNESTLEIDYVRVYQ